MFFYFSFIFWLLAYSTHQAVQPLGSTLHIACAITAEADYFLTTDDEILKRAMHVQGIIVTDPIGFIKEVLS